MLQVSCSIVDIEDILGTCLPDTRLLPDLRYLQLLLADPGHLQTEIGKLIAMRLGRMHSPHTDEELPYHPITLGIFKVGFTNIAVFLLRHTYCVQNGMA